MVFKSIRGSRPASAATCIAGARDWLAKQDHPAYIPRLLSAAIRRARGRWVARQVEVHSDRPHGKAVASIQAPGAIVGGIRRDHGPLRAFLGGPCQECRHELLADAATAVGWIHVDAFQVGYPDGMHAAWAAQAPDQMARHLVAVTCEQDQVVAIREQRRVVRAAVLGGPAQVGSSGVVHSAICCDECINRGDDLREIIGCSCADPDRHPVTLSRREVAMQFSSPSSRSGRPVSPVSRGTRDPLLRRPVCAAGQPAYPQINRDIGLSGSDR